VKGGLFHATVAIFDFKDSGKPQRATGYSMSRLKLEPVAPGYKSEALPPN
jgi:hypothetical protein